MANLFSAITSACVNTAALIKTYVDEKLAGIKVDVTETDPTVPAWAKAENKPSYNAGEIKGLAPVATSGSYNDLSDLPDVKSGLDYSIEEQNTGMKWINGKPIYRQIIKVGEIAAGKNSQLMIAPDFETVIDMRGVIYRGDGVHSALNWRGNGSTVYGWDTYFTSDGMITVRTNSSTKVAGGFIIFEYTKTVDPVIVNRLGFDVLDSLILA